MKKIIATLLCIALILSASVSVVLAVDALPVTYYIGDTVVKTDSAFDGSKYKPDAYAPSLRADLVPANSYFTGWYTNAECNGSPVSPDGTYFSDSLNLYAGFKEYQTSFTPNYSTDGFEKFDVNRIQVFYPRMMGSTFVPNIQNTKGSKTTTTTDYEGDTVWRLLVSGASPYFFYDENAVAYQIKAGSSYKVTFKYKYEFPTTTTTEVFFDVGIGSKISNFTSDGKMSGDANTYKYKERVEKIIPSKLGPTAKTNWETVELVLPALTEDDLENYYPILGFRTTHCSNEGLIDVKDLVVEEIIPEEFSVVYNYLDAEGKETTKVITENITQGQDFAVDFLAPNTSEKYFVGWYTNPQFTGDPVSKINLANDGKNQLYARYKNYQTTFSPVYSASHGGTNVHYPSAYFPTLHVTSNVYGNMAKIVTYSIDGVQTLGESDGTYYLMKTNGPTAVWFVDSDNMFYQVRPGSNYKVTFQYKHNGVGEDNLKVQATVGKAKTALKNDGSGSWGSNRAGVKNSTSVTAVNGDDWKTTTLTIASGTVDFTENYPLIGLYISDAGYGTGEGVQFKNVTVEEIIPEELSLIYNYEDALGNPVQKVIKDGIAVGDKYAIDFIPKNTTDKYFVGWYTNPQFTGAPVSELNLEIEGKNQLYARYKEYKTNYVPVYSASHGGTNNHYPNAYHPVMRADTGKYYSSLNIVNYSINGVNAVSDSQGDYYSLLTNGQSALWFVDEDNFLYQVRSGYSYRVSFKYKHNGGADGSLTLSAAIGLNKESVNKQNFAGTAGAYGNALAQNQSGAVTVNNTDDWKTAELTVSTGNMYLDDYHAIIGFFIKNAGQNNGEGFCFKDLKVEEIKNTQKEDAVVTFENYSVVSKNAKLDTTNKYAIAVYKAEHTIWSNANQDGLWALPEKAEKEYTIYSNKGFAPNNFAIVNGGMNSEKALKFKQTVSGKKYKVADISNGVLLKDNTTYTATFYYKAEGESNKDLKFSVLNALTNEKLGMITSANTVVISAANVASEWTKVTLTFTTDFGYHNADYAISKEMFCIPVICVNHDIDDTARTVYIDNVKLETTINCGGVSVLTAQAEAKEKAQALRVYFNYTPDQNGKITIGGENVSVVKRGVLLAYAPRIDYQTDSDGNYIREKIETPNVFVKENAGNYGIMVAEKAENLTECWANENGVLTYSTYIKNFEINDQKEIAVRGFLELEDGRIIYSEIYNYSVNDIKAVNQLGTEKTYYDFTKQEVYEKLVLQGNSKVLETGITSDWNSQTIKFVANCVGDVTVKVHKSLGCYVRYKILVNGARVTGEFTPVLVDKTNNIFEFTFNCGSKAGVKEIQIVRINENGGGPTEIMGVELIGELEKAQQSNTLIEFLGDSISHGGGDGSRTYAFLAAQKLGFDFRIRSRSGMGFAQSNDGASGIGKSWNYTYEIDSFVRSKTTSYTISKEADVVCIYLGTNDHLANRSKPKAERDALYVSGMKNLISIVKQYNPNAKIVWITGGMTNGYRDAAITTMNDLGGENAGYYVCQFDGPTDDSVAEHPSTEAHKGLSEVFANFLTEKGLVK